MFDWENTIVLDTMQGNRASSRREGKVSWDDSLIHILLIFFSIMIYQSILNIVPCAIQ